VITPANLPSYRLLPLLGLLFCALGIAGCRCSERPSIDADRSDGVIPSIVVPHLRSAPPSIDGKLDDPAWRLAASTGWFVSPGDGKARPSSKVNAQAKLIWDQKHLYFAFEVYDGDPTSPFAPDAEDPHIWERASAVELMIQPGNPGNNSNYFEIQVDVARAVWDTRFDDYNRPISQREGRRIFGHQAWKSQIERAVVIQKAKRRYLLELAVPWRAFSANGVSIPPRAGDVWRINLYAFRDGQRAALAWSPILGRGNFHRAERFGRVTFGAAKKR